MSVPYEIFIDAFLSKISEFDFMELMEEDKSEIVSGYMKRAISSFKKNCKYDLVSTADDDAMEFVVDIPEDDIIELADIISEGMVVQWLKPYTFNQELLQNAINTKDFTTYSPAELLTRIGSVYKQTQKDYIQMIREYSFNHGDLSDLHI